MSGSLFIQPSVARNSESPLVDKPKTDEGQETSPAVAPEDPKKPLNEQYVAVAKQVYPKYQA